MKTLLILLGVCLFSSASFALPILNKQDSTFKRDSVHAMVNNAYQTKTRSFGVGIFPRKDGVVLNMLVENYFVRNIAITITNNKGLIIYTTAIGKRQRQCWLKFNMSAMPDDTYLFVAENGKDKIVKEFKLTTWKSEPVEEHRLITLR